MNLSHMSETLRAIRRILSDMSAILSEKAGNWSNKPGRLSKSVVQ